MTQTHSLFGQAIERLLRWNLLCPIFGVLLLGAAALKIRNLGQGDSFLSELLPQLEWLTIQIEVLMGLWLVSGWWKKLSRIVLLVLLSIFLGASLVMVIQGRSTCGCLGAASVSPFWMLTLDLALVLIVSFSNISSTRIIHEAWASKWRTFVSVGYCFKFVVSPVHPRREIAEFAQPRYFNCTLGERLSFQD